MSFEAFMIVAAVLFCIGLYGSLARRNVLAVLMSIELMFNGVNVTLVAMAKYLAPAALQDDISSVLTGLRGIHHHRGRRRDSSWPGHRLRHVPDPRFGRPDRCHRLAALTLTVFENEF